ncbi:hypothetical protein [Pediococcus stilesii]|uniref:Uncharacterized protein n=1 Tax=Pediococcus stilesii TaxID=331679 RepID=A0A0R2KWU2_9LACO|nr:hypothetical protein [Pediococcus stilesii]KRN94024.1 hypothetical protein IV81_GL001667 [Pediococcus stilesii]TLQ04993.1 hypothetical protein FEZ51_03515 [Pediococcus stilesii]
MDEKKQTRAEYQKSLQKNLDRKNEEVEEPSKTRRNQKKPSEKEQRFNPDERSEEKSRNLAKKLNIAIAVLGIGIILVFLVLFFVG